MGGVVSGSNHGGVQVLVPHACGPVTAADKIVGVERVARQAIHRPMVPCKPILLSIEPARMEKIRHHFSRLALI